MPRRPGELAFTVALVGFAIVALWQSSLISDFEGPAARRLAAPGVFPVLASAVMLVSALATLAGTARRPRATGGFLAEIVPRRLVVVTGLVALYVALMPRLGFLADSGLFLFASFLYLWRRPWWMSLGLAALALGVVWAVFRLLFQVVLPTGDLDRWLIGLG